jgi:hypothetical protein
MFYIGLFFIHIGLLMYYNKIQSLYKRNLDGDRSLIFGDYTFEEFEAVNRWTVTEKIDGTSIRIIASRQEDGTLKTDIGGRTANSQIPTSLLQHLIYAFRRENLEKVFMDAQHIILYGEGYGAKIQGGGYYRKDQAFILFDVKVDGYWLDRDNVFAVSQALEIPCVPQFLNRDGNKAWTTQEIVECLELKPASRSAEEVHMMEGFVARSEPQMYNRHGERIMFKLLCKDFRYDR